MGNFVIRRKTILGLGKLYSRNFVFLLVLGKLLVKLLIVYCMFYIPRCRHVGEDRCQPLFFSFNFA